MQPLAEDLVQVKLTPRAAFNIAFKRRGGAARETLFLAKLWVRVLPGAEEFSYTTKREAGVHT